MEQKKNHQKKKWRKNKMLDATDKIVQGTSEAGIFTNESGAYGVIFKGDKIGMFGADIASAEKALAGKKGE